MAVPGDNLEFHVSPAYRSRIRLLPEIHQAVAETISNRPLSGIVVMGPVREQQVRAGGKDYVVFLARRGNHIGLLAICEASDHEGVEEKREDLRRLFKQGGTR